MLDDSGRGDRCMSCCLIGRDARVECGANYSPQHSRGCGYPKRRGIGRSAIPSFSCEPRRSAVSRGGLGPAVADTENDADPNVHGNLKYTPKMDEKR